MFKKIVLTTCVFSSLAFCLETNSSKSSNFKDFFGEKSEFVHPKINMNKNFTTKNDENLTNVILEKGEVFIHGGNTVKNKFIILNKFIDSKKLINDLNSALKIEFQNNKFKEFKNSLSYEIFDLSLKEKDNKIEFKFIIKYKLVNKENKKNFIEKEISNILNLDRQNSNKEIYNEALNIIKSKISKDIKTFKID